MEKKVLQNLEAMLKSSETALLLIHEKDGKPDVERFLKDAENLIGDYYLNLLVMNEIVCSEKDVYSLSKKMVENGGEIFSYDKKDAGGDKNVIVAFYPDTLEKQRIVYHQCGHIFQTEEILAKITTVNDAVKGNYDYYLEEVHAELFAAACILKDAEGDADYRERIKFLMHEAGKIELEARDCTNFDYPSPKYHDHIHMLMIFINAFAYEGFFHKSYEAIAKGCEICVLAYAKNERDFLKAAC